jgi:hypothetical protein
VQLPTGASVSRRLKSCLGLSIHIMLGAIRFLFGKQLRTRVTGQLVHRRSDVSDADHRIIRGKHESRIAQHDLRYVPYWFEQ